MAGYGLAIFWSPEQGKAVVAGHACKVYNGPSCRKAQDLRESFHGQAFSLQYSPVAAGHESFLTCNFARMKIFRLGVQELRAAFCYDQLVDRANLCWVLDHQTEPI